MLTRSAKKACAKNKLHKKQSAKHREVSLTWNPVDEVCKLGSEGGHPKTHNSLELTQPVCIQSSSFNSYRVNDESPKAVADEGYRAVVLTEPCETRDRVWADSAPRPRIWAPSQSQPGFPCGIMQHGEILSPLKLQSFTGVSKYVDSLLPSRSSVSIATLKASVFFFVANISAPGKWATKYVGQRQVPSRFNQVCRPPCALLKSCTRGQQC